MSTGDSGDSSTQAEEAPPAAPIRFTLPDARLPRVEANLPLRWCLTPEAAQELREKRVVNPHVLIVVASGGREVSRGLVPLLDQMEYVQFHRAGENIVYATVVWNSSGYDDKLEKAFLRRNDRGRYEQDVLSKTGNGLRSWFDGAERLGGTTEFVVDVPAEMFAKRSRWLETYLSFWFRKSETIHTCHTRKRALITLPLFWLAALVIFVNTSIKLVAVAILLLFGKRRIGYHALWQPKTWPKETWQRVTTSVWVTKRDGDPRSKFFIGFNPATVVLALLAFVVIVLVFWGMDRPLGVSLVSLWIIVLVVVGTPIVLGLIFTLPDVILVPSEWSQARKNQRNKRRRQEEAVLRQRLKEKFEEELAALACDGPRPAEVRALPKERQTLYLRFQSIRARVCRPYAQK